MTDSKYKKWPVLLALRDMFRENYSDQGKRTGFGSAAICGFQHGYDLAPNNFETILKKAYSLELLPIPLKTRPYKGTGNVLKALSEMHPFRRKCLWISRDILGAWYRGEFRRTKIEGKRK